MEDAGIPIINRFQTSETCGDKILTSTALVRRSVPTPRTAVAFTAASALEAIEQMRYPVVLKSAVGSRGRLSSLVHEQGTDEPQPLDARRVRPPR